MRQAIILPWPDKRLGANAMRRMHWGQKTRIIKGARLAAAWTAKEQGAKAMKARRILAKITLHPPDARRRDFPNWQYACKPMIDGVADLIGIDDHLWKIEWVDGEPRPKRGEVIMELEAA